MLNKYLLKSGDNQLNLKINLGLNNSFVGYQQEIDDYINIASVDLINETIDPELRRFKYSNENPSYNENIILDFNFTTPPFSNSEISGDTSYVLNSFFIMEVYDSFNENQNTKLSVNYLTKDFTGTTQYNLNKIDRAQFYYLYIPESFILQQTGTTFNIYSRFLFYNAKSGNTSVFYNQYVSPNTDEYTYFNIMVNNDRKTWKFVELTNTLSINQIPETNSSFINKINTNITSFNNKKQYYPSGQTFNYEVQNYFTLSGLTGTVI